MNYWIFQSNPDHYDLRTVNKVADGGEEDWLASRYRNYMTPGDHVFFWLSGPPDIRGIYAVGKLVGSPYQKGEKHYVRVRYERRLKHPLSISEIADERKLRNLWILKMAFGTNFLIDEQEGQTIDALIERAQQ